MSRPTCPSCGEKLTEREKGVLRIRECAKCSPKELFERFRSFL